VYDEELHGGLVLGLVVCGHVCGYVGDGSRSLLFKFGTECMAIVTKLMLSVRCMMLHDSGTFGLVFMCVAKE